MLDIRHYMPNGSGDQFALVHRSSVKARGNPHIPVWLYQIVGGKTWSISFVRLGKTVGASSPQPGRG